jgi:pimeloyl-ACP methyl ester carboxylesterase
MLKFSYDLMAQDILEYCNGHNLTNIDMIGHSMGGKLHAFATNGRQTYYR